jgi:hypothetical protein
MLSRSLNHIGRDLEARNKRTIRIASEKFLPPKGVQPELGMTVDRFSNPHAPNLSHGARQDKHPSG